MNKLINLLSELGTKEIEELKTLIPTVLKDRRNDDKQDIINAIILHFQETNSFGRNIYTAREISELLGAKEYFVNEVIKNYKLNLKELNNE